MPYPKDNPLQVIKTAKWFYAKSQFAAAAVAAFGTPMLSFGAVLGIEIASFLMTLVRKGLIEAHTYHIVYAFSLFINFPALAVVLHGDEAGCMAVFRALVACFIACELRMNRNASKYIAWLLAVVGGMILPNIIVRYAELVVTPPELLLKCLAWTGMMWSVGDTLWTFYKRGSTHLYGVEADQTNGHEPDKIK
eukprot:CAMPEP_0117546990 /NCGR_PEP_ID=MMETSP0784-20121206/46891_1 /TAXON_ID=39447 /ORGANISM="" /LENGTH=192 /DNA_ID=CAMNT_0005343877 /DNA_START=452 /DNA_END=1030 /DNA_ORIENTATION=-